PCTRQTGLQGVAETTGDGAARGLRALPAGLPDPVGEALPGVLSGLHEPAPHVPEPAVSAPDNVRADLVAGRARPTLRVSQARPLLVALHTDHGEQVAHSERHAGSPPSVLRPCGLLLRGNACDPGNLLG